MCARHVVKKAVPDLFEQLSQVASMLHASFTVGFSAHASCSANTEHCTVHVDCALKRKQTQTRASGDMNRLSSEANTCTPLKSCLPCAGCHSRISSKIITDRD